MKALVKSALNTSLYLFGRHRWPLRTSQLVVLGYHRFLPEDHAAREFMQPGMVVSPENFDMQLTELSKYFEFVHLDDWLEKANKGEQLPERSLAITIDDGWSDNYEFAFPVLKKHSVPATIFLVTDMVDTMQSFWPERMFRLLNRLSAKQLAELLSQSEFSWLETVCGLSATSTLDHAEIDNAIMAAKQLSDEDLIRKLDAIEAAFPDDDPVRDILKWSEIEAMREQDLVRFGSHTCSHKRLDKLDPSLLDHELVDSKHSLDHHLDHVSSVFCFPNGNTEASADATIREHYAAACTTQTGWNQASTDPYRIKRFLIHDGMSDSPVKILASLSRTF